MIQLQSKLKIIDNSGGSVGRCIRVLKPHGRKYASVGDVVLISIIEVTKKASLSAHNYSKKSNMSGSPKGKDIVTKGSIKRGTVSKALVVRTKCHGYKNAASFPDGNAVVLLKSNSSNSHSGKNLGLAPVGSRIKGPISNILKLTPSSPIYPSLNITSFPTKGGKSALYHPPVDAISGSLYHQELYKTITRYNNSDLVDTIRNHSSFTDLDSLFPEVGDLPKEGVDSKNVKLGEAAIQYLKVLALSKIHY